MTTLAIGCAALMATGYPEPVTAVGEQGFVWLFRDAANVYTFQYAIRTKAWPVGKPPIPTGDAERQLALLGKVMLCAPDATDQPCKDMLMIEAARRTMRK